MRKLTTTATVLSVATLFALTPAAFARHARDDGSGHDARDDRGAVIHVKSRDNGPKHDAGDDRAATKKANDDPAGHDAGDDRGNGKGKGRR